MIFCFTSSGELEEAVTSGQRALAIATACEDSVLQIVTEHMLGQAYYTQGDYAQSVATLQRTVNALTGEWRHERFGMNAPLSSQSRIYLAWSLIELGAFTEGIPTGEESVQIAEEVQQPYSLVSALRGLGMLYLHQGDLSKAITALERGLGLCRDANFPTLLVHIIAALGYAYALSGRISESLSLLEQATERVSQISLILRSLIWVYLGEILLIAGRVQDAIAQTEHALQLARQHKQRGFEAYALRLFGDIHTHRTPSEIEKAEPYYQQALTLANELGMRPLQSHCHRGLGKLYSQTGQSEQARAELSTAIEMYRDMEMNFWLPETEAALAAVEVQ